VVDYKAVVRRLGELLPGELLLAAPATAIEAGVDRTEVVTPMGSRRARLVINCAGLQTDRVARLAGVDPPVAIIPFRGEYYTLAPEAAGLVRALIYPVPDPRFPFLGVHFTRRIDGSVEVGPNAVLALQREHYRGKGPVAGDLAQVLGTGGFWRLVGRYWKTGAAEAWRSMWRRTYARSAQRLVPELRAEHLRRGGAGVRAQAVNPDGSLVDDFVIVESERAIHVLNAPSPGATASLAIGEHIAGIAADRLA